MCESVAIIVTYVLCGINVVTRVFQAMKVIINRKWYNINLVIQTEQKKLLNSLLSIFLDIIRVGGRSNSKILESRNLNVLRRNFDHHGLSATSRRKLYAVRDDVRTCEDTLRQYTNLNSQSLKGILPIQSFLRVLTFSDLEHTDEILKEHKESILEFLNITLVSGDKTTSLESDDMFEFAPADNEGQFSAANFDTNEENEFQREVEKVVVCFAEETNTPEEIMSNIMKSDADVWLNRVKHKARGFGVWRLSRRERWCLYRLWLSKLHEVLERKIKEELARHLELTTELEELRNVIDLDILRSARVVGMTTTCASKNHSLLLMLRPRIMVIEEAAEVFEAHVVSCLTKYCQHLILIGDHQQLRPKPSVYHLGVKYHLDVSLLERMIKAGVPYNRLSLQHRMRPEIADVIRHIYPELLDHSSVTQYEDVKGISRNVYFIDHCEHEGVRDNIHSKTNTHEANFLVALCHYLLRQGYDSSQVTILTAYTGQMFEIRDLIKNQEWSSSIIPRVSCVDNFQGEENDIILLSLVRNNAEENIGFLKTENRVCVALSRAKKGLYIIGSERILTKQSPLWKSVLDDLRKNNCIGKHLPLVCRNHGTESVVSSDKDFTEKVPNGGCLEPCRFRLECGHACPQTCHPDGHESFLCQKPCDLSPRFCNLKNHKCTKLCHEICDRFCQYLVDRTLPCGHHSKLACSDDERKVACKEQCEKILPCGHRCQDYCGKACTKKCSELVKTTDWSCGHENTMACSATQKDCPIPCKALLDCGHKCTGKCGLCIQGRVHVKCKQKCERHLICSHLCKASCTKNCPPCNVQCIRECKHSRCMKHCGEICIPCREPCIWECKHFKCNKLCSEICDRPRCNKPCNRKLGCSTKSKRQQPHYCRGLCGERCVCVICDKNNEDDITKMFFGTEDEENARFIRLKDCEHIFEYTALDQWMDLSEDGDEIKVKVCPLCKQPVEKTLRYGNMVKQTHQDIDNVKGKLLKRADDIKDKKKLVGELINDARMFCKISANHQYPEKFLQTTQTILKESSKVNYQDVLLLETQLRLLKNCLLVETTYKTTYTDCLKLTKSPYQDTFLEEMDYIRSRIMTSPSNVDMSVLQQIRAELERMSLKKDILIFQHTVKTADVKLNETHEQQVRRIIEKLEGKKVIEDEIIQKFKQNIMEIYQQNPELRIPIYEEEKVQIVKAVGLKQGHWFKCSNGHCYVIGECGGAMEKSQCPECGAVIGGQQHRLEEGNELASEMDGAQHAAWSEQTNLGNYQL